MCEMSVLEGLWGKNTDKEGIAGGRANAQAFSCNKIFYFPLAKYGYTACTIHIFIELMSLHGNTTTIALIALERWMSVEYPLRSIAWITPSRMKRVICIMWIFLGTKVSLETFIGKNVQHVHFLLCTLLTLCAGIKLLGGVWVGS